MRLQQGLSDVHILGTAEWIQVVFVCVLSLVAYLRPLTAARRARISLLGLAGLAVIAAARAAEHWMPPFAASIVQDWVPAAVLLIPYWQVGQFFAAPDLDAEARLAAFDRSVFRRLGIEPAITRIPRPLSTYLELAYLLVYPLVPAGVVVLYVSGHRDRINCYWVVVLTATYVCYLFTLGIQARPPRALPGTERFRIAKIPLRMMNRHILERASIDAITCPSAHVASALAAGLVILDFQTYAGAVFLWLAVSIAVATVVGGYHYVADVLSAVLLAILVFAVLHCA